jgi:3-phosphoshikimate 1-carboxyvinyltransferase
MTHVPMLRVHGRDPLFGSAATPGDKSLSHRVLLLAAIADGDTLISGISGCGDVARTQTALRRLGVTMKDTAEGLHLAGRGPRGLSGPPVAIDCGDSGTTMRLLAGLLSGVDRPFALFGSPGLRARPMRRVTEPLRAMGADISATDGHPPLVGHGGGLRGASVALRRASAQAGSAVLLAALCATGETRVAYPAAVRDHTERMLAEMGAPLRWSPRETRLHGPVVDLAPPGGGRYPVPGDPSSAAFLWTAAALQPGGEVHTPGVCLNPGRDGLLEILRRMGAAVAVDDWRVVHGEPVADITVRAAPLAGVDVGGPLVPRTIDELPLVAVLGAVAHGRTVVRDAAELRLKESDRVAAIVDGLRRMGASIHARDDGFVVEGPTALHGAALAGHGDHRIVMSLAVAATAASGESQIEDGDRPADSFPGFVKTLRALGADIREEG